MALELTPRWETVLDPVHVSSLFSLFGVGPFVQWNVERASSGQGDEYGQGK
jgi:hypothetical protein